MKKNNEILQLIEKLKQSPVSIRKIAKSLGIPEQRIYGWTNKGATPGHEDVQKLRLYFGEIQNILEDSGGLEGIKITNADRLNAHDALFSVLVAEVAALRSERTGEPVQSVIVNIYKAAADAAKNQ